MNHETNAHALLLVADPVIRADALRVAAAADCVVQEGDLPVGKFPMLPAMRLQWDGAVAVLVDLEAAEGVESSRLPRRENVVLLARGDLTVDHWRTATAIGAANVVALPHDEELLIRILGTRRDDVRAGGGVIAVVGARGGAGATALSAAIALCAAAAGDRTLLVDGDEYGGGLDLTLGWEDEPGLRWPGLVVEGGRILADALHGALPSRGSLSVLSAGRTAPGRGIEPVAVGAVLDAGRRAGDLVVCDVPRTPGPHTDSFHDTADLIVLVVPAEIGAVAAAENIADYLTARNSNVGLVVRGPAPGGLRGSQIADALDLPLLAAMRPEPGLASRIERTGLVLSRRSPLRAAATVVLDTFARKPRAAA